MQLGKSSEAFGRTVPKPQQGAHKKIKTKIVLIPVKGANQAQIRIGRFLTLRDINNPELLSVMSEYLGGNFASVLNDELRSRRGLVYSVGSFAQGQKYYGRAAVVTFSRNENVKETIGVIRDTLYRVGNGDIPSEQHKRTINFLKGGHLFQFESYDPFLKTLMFFDHVERNWKDLYNYPQIIERFSVSDMAQITRKIFNWNDLLVVVVGHRSLLKDLKKIGTTQVLGHINYL